MEEIDRQLPDEEQIFLDHVGHFVPDPDGARDALTRAGFVPTPASFQVNPDPAGGSPKPAGTGNVTAVFSRGYMEVLFKTADTPLGREFDRALERYPGLHLAAFSVADAAAAHARLGQAGFALQPLVSMQRPVETEIGPDIAAFTVARLQAGQMPEGRMQILTHRTEATVWQPRWLRHPNGALGLVDLVIAEHDVAEAAERFARFVGPGGARGRVSPNQWGVCVQLDRGRIQLVSERSLTDLFPGLTAPNLPFIAGYGLRVAKLGAVETIFAKSGLACSRFGMALLAPFPPELGHGAWAFVERAEDLPWRC